MTPRNTFSREWITVGSNRILLRERDGSPSSAVHRAALLACWVLDEFDSAGRARVVEVYRDNRHVTALRVAIGSDDEADYDLADRVRCALEGLFEGIVIDVIFHPVAVGLRWSDCYDHTEHVVTSVLKAMNAEAYLA